MRRRRENWRTIRGTFFLLHFQFRGQNGGRGGRNRNGAGLRAAITVEHFRSVACGYDFRECGQRCSDNIHAANQFIRTAIGEHFEYDERKYLEGLRLSSSGKRKAAGDIVNQQSKRFSLGLDELDQLCAQLRVREGLAALHDQVTLPGNRSRAELTPSMAVGIGEAHQRRARHFKIFQDSMLHQRNRLRRNTFVIELVVTQQVLVPELLLGGVVHDAQETRQDWFADFFRKGLAFGSIFLAVSFRAVAKDFMEKDGGRAARQQSWTNRGLDD